MRAGTEPVPAVPGGDHPYAEISSEKLAVYRLAAVQRPRLHPRPGAAPVTAPMAALPVNARPVPAPGREPALARPYAPPASPAAPEPEPAAGQAPAAPGGLPDCVPYCAPGWAGLLMSLRVRSGEWEDVVQIVERGWGRNAAENAAARRHVREGIAEAARQFCSALGCPEMTGALLGRVSELSAAGGAL